MSSFLNEGTQFADSDGNPIVSGSIYFGDQNTDPTILANRISIYSDRELTTSIANPQTTDAYGRTTNKVWLSGKYSLVVTDSEGSQEYSELDNGELSETGITTLTSVAGVNTITASGVPTISALVDKQTYIFTSTGTVTGATTLKIDGTATKSVTKNHTEALIAGDIELNQVIQVVYNETTDVFELTGAIQTLLDEDDMASDSAVFAPTQQSVKAYVDTEILGAATVTGHIKAGNTQILSGDDSVSASYPFFDIDSNLTELAWESVGGTSSGSDNIWTALDNMPSSARILIVDLQMIINSTALQQSSASIYACSNDIAGPSLDIETNMIGSYSLNRNNTDNEGILIRTFIPVDSSQLFKLLYTDTLNDLGSYTLYYRGFITD